MQLLAVNFHYIRDDKPEAGIYPRSREEFATQLEEIGKYYDFMSQPELIRCIQTNDYPSGCYCMLTFDDNLKEQLSAYEILEDKKIPAIFYSTTLPYLEKKVHDVHKVHHVFMLYEDSYLANYLDDNFGFYNFSFSKEQLHNSYKYDSELKKKIKIYINFILTPEQRESVIDHFFCDSIDNYDDFINDFYLSKDELRMLSDRQMLGSHTHSHFPLASTSTDTIHHEISTSVEYLNDLTGRKISSISYPYGRSGAVNQEVADVAKQNRLVFGFTMYRGLNHGNDIINPLLLKRVDTNDAPGGKLDSLEFLPRKD